MPPIFRTVPMSPDLVRNACSSQNPYRLICAGNEPASFQSFVIESILSMAIPDRDFDRIVLHWVVAAAELSGVEQHAQDLHVVLRGDTGNDDADDEQTNAANQRDEEQPSLRAENRQRAVHRFVNSVLSKTALCHLRPPSCLLRDWVVVGPAADYPGKSQAMKFTAPTAMPMPKMIPASMRLDWPSP